MGRRTLNAHKLTFSKLREPDNLCSPVDINGRNLIDLVETWAKAIQDDVVQVRPNSYMIIKKMQRFNNNILIVDTLSGKSGEAGIVYDLEGEIETVTIGEMQVPMASARAVLFSPSNGQMAMWFSEYGARSSGARELLTCLNRSWPSLNTGAKFNEVRIIADDILLEKGRVTEIEVRHIRRARDLADGTDTRTGTYSYVFKPSKKESLSAKIISKFRDDPAKAYDYVEIGAQCSDSFQDESDVFVSVDVDGRKRKIRISDPEDGIYFHVELNGPNDPILSNEELVEFCSEEATRYFKQTGYNWDPLWSETSR